MLFNYVLRKNKEKKEKFRDMKSNLEPLDEGRTTRFKFDISNLKHAFQI